MHKKKLSKTLMAVIAILGLAILGMIITIITNNSIEKISLDEAGPVLEMLKERFPDSPIYEQINDPSSIVLVANPEGLSCEASRVFVGGLAYPHHIYQINDDQYLQEIIDQETCPIDEASIGGLRSYPTIFIKDTVYIGFNKKVKKEILNMIAE